MHPISYLKLAGLCGAAMTMFAATGAAAAAADYYLKLGDIKGQVAGKQIEIMSWSWGATSTAKYGAVAGAHRDDSLNPAEKRQHGWVTVSKPLDRGAVRVKVKLPWLECRVGAAFPDAVLQNDAGRYEFKDAIITGCAPDSVTLDYAKVKVRGWDPAKASQR